jgi:hypothetical protein
MDATERALFLRKIHLFNGLDDDQLLEVAEKFTEVSFDTGEIILEQGTQADSFYLTHSGKVRVFRRHDGSEQELATLVSGDYFGEMEILKSRGARVASISALEPTLVLRITNEDFAELLETYPTIKPNIEVSVTSRILARKIHFKWLRPGEVVYFLARKHSFFLLQALIAPVIALLIPAFLFLWGGLAQSIPAAVIGGVMLVLILGWIAWSAIDWGNDYYVVTNQRVVWLEKVIGLYDSRNEAPLTEILSATVDTDLIGRALGYGDVLIRTYVGAITFRRVTHPHQAAHMIDEYWQRTQQVSKQAEKEAFKSALRERLGLLQPSQEDEEPPKEEEETVSQRPNFLKIFIVNLFRQRIEEGNIVTYRKHWFVLVQQTFLPAIIFWALFGLFVVRLYTLFASTDGFPGLDSFIVILLLFLFIVFCWWLYQYVDWTNDIFRVTEDQILDIDRKPFGTEERRAAPLDNILGTQYERIGFLGYILNFGTVYIDIGSAQFAFEDVLDPAVVQSDIDRRRLARLAAKRDADKADERNRMADWIASYHLNVDDIRQEEELRDTKPKSE